MLPPPSPRNIIEIYNNLLSLLHPTPPAVLELDILPASSFPSPQRILHEKTSIAIPSPLLLQCHLHALSVLFSRSLPLPSIAPTTTVTGIPPGLNYEEEEEGGGEGGEVLETKYLATTIILLQEPTHLTAANVRKRYLLSLPNQPTIPPTDPPNNPQPDADTEKAKGKVDVVAAAVERETYWLESLLTSPLYKHAKSPVLWLHRLWLLQTFPQQYYLTPKNKCGERRMGRRRWMLVNKELAIVMKAGERHPRNYYAWNYARDIVRLGTPTTTSTAGEEVSEGEEEKEWESCVAKVHKWCLSHPRDISGWSFLLFLLLRTQHHPSSLTPPPPTADEAKRKGGEEAEMMDSAAGGEARKKGKKEATIREIFARTRDFVEKYGWEGESIEWFLGSIT